MTAYPVAVTESADSFVVDDRLRLFSFATAEKRADYLRVLRAFEHARTGYVVLLHAGEVAEILARTDGGDTLTGVEIGPLLEQLHTWGVLERSYDGTRAATLAEYRNRHYVYQFGQVGYQAYRAVEDVLAARPEDASLSRLVLPELLADLEDLAAANLAGDADLVYRKLDRLDTALNDMATRAAHFYLSLGDLVRTTDVTPESFLAHKDALLSHMREFSLDLARFGPKLTAAIERVDATGLDSLLDRVAASDERVFLSREERRADWAGRWTGLVHWFTSTDGELTESDRLREGTMSAIATVLSLLRRVIETRRGGVSRESQLRHLAGWFASAPSEESAHALFGAVFGLGRPRHLSMVHPDDDIIPTTRSWWDAPPVEISRTLAETGRPPAAGAPARVHRNDAGVRRLREEQLSVQRRRAQAARSLAEHGVYERDLTNEETDVLLGLLNAALTARVPVSGRVGSSTGSEGGVTLTLAPHEQSTVVRTERGLLHLERLSLTIGARR
ncbi:TIGR02677 family protein [Rhodococcus sp. BP-316]|nr:TIGR02677 family protein [Rhodococcus sp. BP-316]